MDKKRTVPFATVNVVCVCVCAVCRFRAMPSIFHDICRFENVFAKWMATNGERERNEESAARAAIAIKRYTFCVTHFGRRSFSLSRFGHALNSIRWRPDRLTLVYSIRSTHTNWRVHVNVGINWHAKAEKEARTRISHVDRGLAHTIRTLGCSNDRMRHAVLSTNSLFRISMQFSRRVNGHSSHRDSPIVAELHRVVVRPWACAIVERT